MATILVVDDYLPNNRLMSFVLEQYGYAVAAAFDGRQALELLANISIDLILTDLSMPNMDGLELIRAIRTDPCYAMLPIILVTASVREHDHVCASGIGVSAFLTKPVDSEDLVHEVKRLLEQKVSSGGGAAVVLHRSNAA